MSAQRHALENRNRRLAWLVPALALCELLAAAWQRAVPASTAPQPGAPAPAAIAPERAR